MVDKNDLVVSHDGFPGGSVVKNPPAMQEMWVRSLGREDTLEEGMATHYSVLAWKIPWTEKPGGLHSMGLQGWTQLKWLSTWYVWLCGWMVLSKVVQWSLLSRGWSLLSRRLYLVISRKSCLNFHSYLGLEKGLHNKPSHSTSRICLLRCHPLLDCKLRG